MGASVRLEVQQQAQGGRAIWQRRARAQPWKRWRGLGILLGLISRIMDYADEALRLGGIA